MIAIFVSAILSALGVSVPLPPQEPAASVPREAPVIDSKPMAAYEIDVTYAAFSGDGKLLLTVGHDRERGGNLKIWEVGSRKILKTFDAGGSGCEQLHSSSKSFFTPNVGANGWQLQKWDIATGNSVVVHAENASAHPVAIWPDRDLIALTAETPGNADGPYVLKLLNYKTKKETLIRRSDKFNVLRFSSDRKLVALGFGDLNLKIFVVDWARDKTLCEFNLVQSKDGFIEKVTHVFFSTDGRFAYVTISGGLRPRLEKWDITRGEKTDSIGLRWMAPGPGGPVAMSPDGRKILCSRGRVGGMFDLVANKEGCAWFLRGDSDFVATAVAISADGRTAAVGGSDGKLRIFSVEKAD
jgi:WD40 repeat protein